MRILLGLTCLLVLLGMTGLAVAMEVSSQMESAEVNPHIVEYIPTFTINTNDLEKVVNQQLKSIKLGDIKTSYAHITDSTVSISQYGSERKIEQITPLKVRVINDTFVTFVIFSVHVLHTVGGKNYTCNTSVPLTYVNYVKVALQETQEIDLQTGNLVITGLNTTFSSKTFSQANCKESETGKDKTRIQQVVNATQGNSIYTQLIKTFAKLQEYFTVNSQGEHLSKIYEKNPYVYDFYGFTISINVSTIQATKFGDSGVQNNILGSIAGTSKAASAPPAYEQGFTSFYSIEFFQNMIAYSKDNYAGWKNVKLNGKNMQSRVFKYRLIDFENVIPQVLTSFPKNYLSDVEFECNIEAMQDFVIDETNLTQNIDWRCLGSFEIEAGKRETFVNFVVSMKHVVQLTASQTYLVPYIKDVQFTNIKFDLIGYYEVTDISVFALFLKESLYAFRLYTIGQFFKVSAPNNKVKLVPGRGVWIG